MRRSTILFLVAIPLTFFLLDRVGLLAPIKGATLVVFTPVSKALIGVAGGVTDMARALWSLPALIRENNELAAENNRLAAELAGKTDLVHENAVLRSELSLPASERSREGIAAFVVGKSRTGAFGTFLINRGERDGIQAGRVVFSQGVLVGRVTEVFASTSIVTPITNVNSVIPVVLAESRGMGLLKGGVRGLSVEEVPRDVAIKQGEAVVTSALGGVVPAGILVGTVQSVTGNPADVFQTVAVKPSASFNTIELVMVAK